MTISLCVVARNEALFLGACLESARPVVDEMIVVDTGSSDATVDIARRAGATVVRAPWPGDLGRAHNLPLAYARGDWVLSLDGDELLDPSSRDEIPRLARAGGADGYRLPIRNYTYHPPEKLRLADARDPLTRGALAYLPTTPVRLFRRRGSSRFTGQLHQTMAPAIRQAGGRIRLATAVIHHYGFLRTDRVKTALYRILARRQVALTPRAPRAWIDLGLAFATRRELAASLAAFRQAYRLGRRGEAAYRIGATLVEMDRAADALPFLEEAVRRNWRDDAIDFDRADACELLGHAWERLGQERRAKAAYRRALRLRPASPAALNNLAGLLMEHEELENAAPLVSRLVAEFPGLSPAWATSGALHLRCGRIEAARRACEIALDIAPLNRPAWINLSLAHAAAGRPRLAARAAASARELTFGDRVFPGAAADAPAARTRRRMPAADVVSVTSYLHGGSGRVLVDAVAALPGRRHLVLCLDAGEAAGQHLRRELRRLGAEVAVVGSDDGVLAAIRRTRPGVVLHHWSAGPPLPGPVRSGDERWVAIGHSPLPMPAGYDRYVVLSAFQQQFQSHLPAALVRTIPNAVTLRPAAPRRRPGGRVTIAMLTRLDTGKFPRQLPAFLPSLGALNARLVVAGRGPRRYELEPEIARAGLPVAFVGPIVTARVPAFLDAADIGLHLTETHQETCSMTILEMLAAGLPIVAEPKGCLPDMVVDGWNGFLASDPREIAARIATLASSATLRRTFGARSRRQAAAHGMPRYRRAMRALVREVLASPPPPAAGAPSRHTPEDVSLRGWTPALTYVVCAPSGGLGRRLADALRETGIAGMPGTEDGGTQGWRALRGGALARVLAARLEASATANGVSGTLLGVDDLRALVTRLGGRRGLTRAFPNLHLVTVDEPDGAPGHSIDDIDAVRIRLPAGTVAADPVRAAERVVAQLGLTMPRPL